MIPQVLAPIDVYEICDRCGVKAKVAVEFISGELYFCGHHARMNAEFLYQKALKIYDPYQELDKL